MLDPKDEVRWVLQEVVGHKGGALMSQINALFKNFQLKLIHNAVLVSRVHHSDSVFHTYFFQILFNYRLLQGTECGPLCCTVGPCSFYI